MIIAQLNLKFKFSNRTGILTGRHKKYKMRVIEIACLSIAILPRNSSSFYWDSLDKLAMDKDYLIKNCKKVEEAIEKAEEHTKAELAKYYKQENDRLMDRNAELETRHVAESNNIRAMKKTIKIVTETQYGCILK